VQDLPEGLRHPEILALQVKEVLLRHIPEEYVSVWQEGSGWSRQERYSFRKPVPMELVRGAMQQAGFEWRVAWFGSIAERAFFFTDLGSKWRAIRDHIERTIDEHIRAVAETAPGTQLTATLQIDSSVLEPLMTHIERWMNNGDCITILRPRAFRRRAMCPRVTPWRFLAGSNTRCVFWLWVPASAD
jgi:hypothetical protein